MPPVEGVRLWVLVRGRGGSGRCPSVDLLAGNADSLTELVEALVAASSFSSSSSSSKSALFNDIVLFPDGSEEAFPVRDAHASASPDFLAVDALRTGAGGATFALCGDAILMPSPEMAEVGVLIAAASA